MILELKRQVLGVSAIARRTIAKIGRMHFAQGMGIKTTCRERNLSKKVVRKVVLSGTTEFSYKRTV